VTAFRIEIRPSCIRPLEVLQANARANAHRRRLQKCAPHGRKLAVVGGGPHVLEHLEELRAWDGDIWGINHTAQWLCDQGIDATMFSVDPLPFAPKARKAILATVCDPAVFDGIPETWAFDTIETHTEGLAGGSSSATRAPAASFFLGYLNVSFFGCEGSYQFERSHVDRNLEDAAQFIVKAGEHEYLTCSQFLIQCQELATLVRTFPDVYHDRSGGLLAGMIDHPDTWSIVAVSASMKQHLEEVNGAQGLYEEPYELRRAS